MWALVVEALDEGIEPRLLLQHVAGGRLRGFLLQCQMHPLVPAVLLRLALGDALDLNPEPEPPHGQFTEPVDRLGGRERDAVVGPIPCSSPNSLNVRSKTVKANRSGVVDSASHVSRCRLAKSVIVSG